MSMEIIPFQCAFNWWILDRIQIFWKVKISAYCYWSLCLPISIQTHKKVKIFRLIVLMNSFVTYGLMEKTSMLRLFSERKFDKTQFRFQHGQGACKPSYLRSYSIQPNGPSYAPLFQHFINVVWALQNPIWEPGDGHRRCYVPKRLCSIAGA